jgi:hypothetical protein
VCRMKLRVVLYHFVVFCKGFSTLLMAELTEAAIFGLSTFGVCLNGVLGGQIGW